MRPIRMRWVLILAVIFSGLNLAVQARDADGRCYDWADLLRIKIGDLELNVPSNYNPYVSSKQRKEKIYSSNDIGLRFGYCQAPNDPPLQGDGVALWPYALGEKEFRGKRFMVDGKKLEHLNLLVVNERMPFMKKNSWSFMRGTFCAEQPHLSEYKPCDDQPGFMCREDRHKNYLRYSPAITLLGRPVIFNCGTPNAKRRVKSCFFWDMLSFNAFLSSQDVPWDDNPDHWMERVNEVNVLLKAIIPRETQARYPLSCQRFYEEKK